MAYADEDRALLKGETIKRQQEKKQFTFKMFARKYVNLNQNAMQAAREMFPNIKNDNALVLEKNKLMKNPYVLREIEKVKKEALQEAGLTIGKLAQERWKQYDKYKDDPKMWKAADSALVGLEKLMPKDAQKDDESKRGSNIHIYLPQQLPAGAPMDQPDYSQVPKELTGDVEEQSPPKEIDAEITDADK